MRPSLLDRIGWVEIPSEGPCGTTAEGTVEGEGRDARRGRFTASDRGCGDRAEPARWVLAEITV